MFYNKDKKDCEIDKQEKPKKMVIKRCPFCSGVLQMTPENIFHTDSILYCSSDTYVLQHEDNDCVLRNLTFGFEELDKWNDRWWENE